MKSKGRSRVKKKTTTFSVREKGGKNHRQRVKGRFHDREDLRKIKMGKEREKTQSKRIPGGEKEPVEGKKRKQNMVIKGGENIPTLA